ncbi:hypothetical protein [Methanolapillus ohkumae]|uniref:Uncharacterized protein n=1 Tax=Methanolapillus ohkumae TaxID=3028298 RepID=A0AA96ZVS3_9EURY|nr:hypothetical protein MsAm2_08190 [Methanosarcinaceae archaeon Am2]
MKTNMIEIRDKIRILPFLENKMFDLEMRIRFAEEDTKKLLSRYEKECFDVRMMQSKSLSGFVLKITGKYEKSLEKQKQQEIEAKLNYDKVAANLDVLNDEKIIMEKQISELLTLSSQYHQILRKRRAVFKSRLSKNEKSQFLELDEKRQSLLQEKTEIIEAIQAGIIVQKTADSTFDMLDSADNWATFDLWFGGGILTYAAKYDRIDKAERLFGHLSAQLKEFESELKDVQNLDQFELNEISQSDRIIDFWFDNFFTDFSVRNQIRTNMNQLVDLMNKIKEMDKILNQKLEETNSKLEENRAAQEEILISLPDVE